MCKKMYNDLCEICQVADNFAECSTDFDSVTLDAITKNVVECKAFVAVPKIKIKCTYECKELGKIAVVEKEVYKLPDLPWEDKKPKTKKSKFKKPTIDEINAYCAEKGYTNVDADAFINYYDSVGWKIGKTLKPMKSWKGAVATWSRQQSQYENEKRKKENKDRLQSKPTYDIQEYERAAMLKTEI